MKLEEAIKVLANIAGEIDMGHADDDLDALQLGIEALKRISAQRNQYPEISSRPLPGETE